MSQAQAWELLRWRSRVLVHRQELAPAVVLSLARIPAGSFLRGARDGGDVNPARGRLI
ncbi:MAG: hypothetical protein VKO00_10795 [Cyanobacteriota bacterium]|nr:hypothetical protein [Cyanobacteriota bacterium]